MRRAVDAMATFVVRLGRWEAVAFIFSLSELADTWEFGLRQIRHVFSHLTWTRPLVPFHFAKSNASPFPPSGAPVAQCTHV